MFGPSRCLSVQLLWPLLIPDQSRRRLLAVALRPSLRSLPVRSSAAGSLPQRPDHSVEQRSPLLLRNVGNRLPIRSPQARTRCFRAQGLHLPCPPYPVGFVWGANSPAEQAFYAVSVRHLALLRSGWQPLTALASFKRAGACACKPRVHPSDKSSRPCPCLRLVVIMASS
jgi:hypothetical protein